MKLFLASHASNPTSLNEFKKFVGGFENKTMVYIPTAGNGEGWGSWKDSSSLKLAKELPLKELKIIELEKLIGENPEYPSLEKAIGQPDILWVAGGMMAYLLYWIRRVGLDEYLPKILQTGTTYIGSSAGSMICSKTQNVNDWYIGETEKGGSLLPGLGLIDFEIYPHYQDELLPEIKKRHQQRKICLLKDGEAVVIENNEIKIFGEERFIEK